jgi:NitT/TauT family transport system ATP-binding protein
VVFQDYSLYPWFNCRDNIVLALEQAGLGASRANRNMIAEEFLELVGLRADADKLPGELSGGMRQRTAIARALAINAPILLMDEPFGALDEITRARQQDLLLDLWHGDSHAVIGGGTGKTVFFVTHDVEEAIILGNRVIVMGTHPGRIVRDLAVELPRPRSRKSAIHHPNFVTLRDNLLHDLNLVVDEQLNHCEVLEDGAGI